MPEWIAARDLILLALGGVAGVACSELWRWLRPPEELVILRDMQRQFSRAAKANPAAKGIDLDAAFRPMRERAARYALGRRRARLANVGAATSLVAALFVGANGAGLAAFALLGVGLASFVASEVFRRAADRAWR